MAIRADAAAALVLALGLHGIALALIVEYPSAGAVAAGDGGTELVTIAPVLGEVAALIATWESAPVVVATAPDVPEAMAEVTADLPELLAPAIEMVAPAVPEPPTPPVTLPAMTPPAAAEAPPPETVQVATPSADRRPKPRPEPKPTPTSTPKAEPNQAPTAKPAPVPAATASGQGGGGAAGQAGQAQAGTADSARVEDALTAWGAEIRARIERKKTYPRAADGATGVVTLVITVSPEGDLWSAWVAASSDNPVLDAAAVQAVQSARLPKGPVGMDPAGHSFRFRLRYER